MIIIGLTGSIGMGKSTVAQMFRAKGLLVHDSDATVHALLKKNGAAVPKVARLFPESVKDGAIDRKKLGAMVFGDPSKLKTLEKIIHPLVQKEERAFIVAAKRNGKKAVVLEIPLLFETGAEKRCDRVVCVSATAKIQKERVLKRKGMTDARFKAILKSQMSDAEKRRNADVVIRTDKGIKETRGEVAAFLQKIFGQT